MIDTDFHRQPQYILCITLNEAAVFILSYILLPEQQWFGFGFLCFSILLDQIKKKKKLKKERDRKVQRRKGKWPAGRAATGSRRLRLSPMQQLATKKIMMLFCHVFPLVLYTSSYWPSTHDQIEGSAVAGRRGLSGDVTWPVGTKMRGIKKLHVGFQAVFQRHEHLPFIFLDRSQTDKLKTTAALFIVLLCKSYFSGLVYQNHVVMPGLLTMKTRAEI